MPGYIYADPDQRGTSNINYRAEKRGDLWWYEREVRITRPGSTDELFFQWFGGYDSEEECNKRIEERLNQDKEFSELYFMEWPR